MIKRELADLCIDEEEFIACLIDGGGDKIITEKLLKLNAGEYFERQFNIDPITYGYEGIDKKKILQNNRLSTTSMMEYLETLRTAGYDIGKGEAEFGYRMPLPGKDANTRVLRIFRRK